MQAQYKITTESNAAGHTMTILLNGRFSEDALPELDHSISSAKVSHREVFIDLSEVTLVDRKAVEYISEQVCHDVKVVNCPIYLRRWITNVETSVNDE